MGLGGKVESVTPAALSTGRLRVAERAAARSPAAVFAAIVEGGREAALLLSGEGFGEAGAFSFIGLDPAGRFRFGPDEPGDPFALLRDALDRTRWTGEVAPPVPFFGGWIGFLSYDLLHHLEEVPRTAVRDHGFPLMDLRFYPRVLAYDHARQVWTACVLEGEGEGGAAEALLDWVDAPPAPRAPGPALAGDLVSNFTRRAYEAAVARVLDYIATGDVYQVNLSQRFAGRLRVPALEVGRRLFDASPAPFSAFLRHPGTAAGRALAGGDQAIVSSSPERFLRVRGDAVETWPIKGTRPRGRTPGEDAHLRAELLDSAKDAAELTMITDLLRNDLGRVCRYGSVRVPEERVLESFEQVHHTRSTVVGRLRAGLDRVDLLRATMPGGSVTGAPKIRATEIIDELEPTARGPYCGAVGWLGVDGSMDLNIPIRTVLVEGDRLSFQVGGGVVADSRPDLEYEETLHKARGILQALGAAPATT